MRPVQIVIHRLRIGIHHVIAVNIIHIAVGVVIDSIPRNFTGIDPHLVHQIRVRIIHPGIHHRHNDFIGG